MNRICGMELKGSEAILAVLDCKDGQWSFIDIEPRKIKLGDDGSIAHIQSFYDSMVNFLKDNRIDLVVLKKRPKKATMAGGAVSFKMEALIQLNGAVDVKFVTGQGIAAEAKKTPFVIPSGILKYQETAFVSVLLFLRKR